MTLLHGDVTKVYEVLKKGYEQPIVQTAESYTITTGAVVPGVHTYDLPVISSGKTGYIKRISATCNDSTSIHQVWINSINGGTWTFFNSYFVIGYEWLTGDVIISDTDTWTVSINNNAGGNVSFTINVYWMES